MRIETKFDVGQIVWIMFNNQPETWRIDEIVIYPISNNHYSTPSYKLHHHGKDHLGSVHETTLYEYEIGATKTELLKSFLSDGEEL